MRKLTTILTLLVTAIVFTCCGSDRPDDLPVSRVYSAEKSFSVFAVQGATSRIAVEFKIDDFTGISEYKKYIESVLVQTNSYIELTGISGRVELTDVRLSLERDSKKSINLPDITENVKFQDLPRLTFLQNVMDEIDRRGSSTVVLEYKSSYDMETPAKLTLRINSQFNFN